MRRLLLALALAGLAGCGTRYDRNDLELVTAYRATMLCSCLFVMERDETYCTNWTREAPDIATFSIDREKKSVRTQGLVLWGREARFLNDKDGCVLE